jgi:hypothetical protein
MDDDHRVVVLRRDRLDQLIAIEPRRQILPVKCVRELLSKTAGRAGTGYLPVTRVAVNSNVALARIGLQEHDCNILLHRGVGRSIEVKVVKEP